MGGQATAHLGYKIPLTGLFTMSYQAIEFEFNWNFMFTRNRGLGWIYGVKGMSFRDVLEPFLSLEK